MLEATASRDPNGAPLLALPMEVLEHILLFCHPRDVARFSQTCRFSTDLVYRSADQYFWRHLFLSLFDDPRHSIGPLRGVDPSSYDWKAQLKGRIEAERDASFKTDDPELESAALETLVSVSAEALPLPSPPDKPVLSRNVEWLKNIVGKTDIVQPLSLPNQWRDRLKSCLAIHFEDNPQALRTQSRCFVYDVRNYNSANLWGPYLRNGDVNWSHLYLIINVVAFNIRELPLDNMIRPPTGSEATRAHSAPGDFTGQDWAGVEGTWLRYVSFMDYRDLFGFNFSGSEDGAREPSFFDDEGFREATRLIELNLHIISKEKMRVKFPHDDPPSRVHPSYEVLYFAGTSRGASTGQETTVQGFVHMGLDHIPRWRLTSIHDGQTQWSTEGVQIGNVGSAIGVAGTWSAFEHGDGDPVGPTWFWKVESD
ncbi:F-box domain-containing protein [Favolaschia claudopus]|uniref:F-box domain-containing protein n=1 Tax=Favolaschia claudopus TaxID=2862362 RepID=A0AAW0EHU9_9AGAR